VRVVEAAIDLISRRLRIGSDSLTATYVANARDVMKKLTGCGE
jgi:hypothetical protein